MSNLDVSRLLEVFRKKLTLKQYEAVVKAWESNLNYIYHHGEVID